jgi:hypothetical protein
MNPWVLVGFAVAVSGAFGTGYWRGDTAGQAKVQQLWDKEKAAQYAAYAAGQAAAREKEQAMQANADQLRQEKDREIRNISARATALANSLRDRPERPAVTDQVSDAPEAGPASSGCTGSGLYKADGNFLVGEAARANTLRELLKECRANYETLTKE